MVQGGSTKMDMKQVNSMSYEEFVDVFGNVIEHCRFIAAIIWSKEGFKTLTGMHDAICELLDSMTTNGMFKNAIDPYGFLKRYIVINTNLKHVMN